MNSVIDLSKVSDRKEVAVMSESTALISVIERAARDPNIDIDKMERLLAMQMKIFDKQAETAFNTAMSACQAEIPIIKATFKNEQTGSFYAALEELDRIARPIYTRHGFGLSFGTADCPIENLYRQTCKVSHSAGHSEIRFADLPLDTLGPKGTPNKTAIQGFSSSMTYGQRIITRLVFNIVIGDDTDGNGPTLGPGQIETVRARMKEVGTNESQFLEFWKIDSLEKMPAFNYPVIMDMLDRKAKKIDPRGDLSGVDFAVRNKWVDEIKFILDQDKEEETIAAELREVSIELNKQQELYITVLDELAKRDIITKKNWKKLTAMLDTPPRDYR